MLTPLGMQMDKPEWEGSLFANADGTRLFSTLIYGGSFLDSARLLTVLTSLSDSVPRTSRFRKYFPGLCCGLDSFILCFAVSSLLTSVRRA